MRWISSALAVALAMMVSNYFTYSHECWMVLAALLTSQASRGAPIRVGLVFLIQMSFAMIVASFLKKMILQPVIMDLIVASTQICFFYIAYMYRPLFNKSIFTIMLFPLSLLIAVYMPESSSQPMHDRVIDITVGSVLGILFGQLILTVQPYRAFSQGVIPYLRSLIAYSQRIEERLINRESKDNIGLLSAHNAIYPEWVYEAGFNPGLRSGFRYFLLNMERLGEILSSMSYFVSIHHESTSMNAMAADISNVIKKNNELMLVLVGYFQNNQLQPIGGDFTADMSELEHAYKRVVPVHIELLDFSPDYLALSALVRDVKDMRELLLKLLLSLNS